MYKKIIAVILMITMLSLSAQVAVGDMQMSKISEENTDIKVELMNYLVLEGYSEKEANNLISNLSEEQIHKLTKEILNAKSGGFIDTDLLGRILLGMFTIAFFSGYGIGYLISQNSD